MDTTSNTDASTETDPLSSEINFPCGRRAHNRLAKAALYEALTSWGGGAPNDELFGLYHLWARGQWGIVITGNVQVSDKHLTVGRDMCVPEVLDDMSISPFKNLASIMHGNSDDGSTNAEQSPLALMQINHSGRQSPRFVGGRFIFDPPLGASDVPMKSRSESWIGRALFDFMFVPPRAATDEDVEDVMERFVRGAQLSVKAGFDGVQLHCSHGYLLAQFMSPKTNTRSPPYGPPSSLYLLRTIISRIRAIVPSTHILALKLNASDYVKGGLTEEHALEHVRVIAGLKTSDGRTCVDMIEVSGGDYETPAMLAVPSRRQAFFATFSRKALEVIEDVPNPPRIMLTGGFTSTLVMAETLRANHADIIGLGRASIADPLLPRRLFRPLAAASDCPASSTAAVPSNRKIETGNGHPSQRKTLAPNPPPPWWTPPEVLANASVSTAQWTALLHRRATLGASILDTSLSSSDGTKEMREDQLMPLVSAIQHEGALRSVVEFVVRAEVIDQVVWLIKSFVIFSLGVGISLVLKLLEKNHSN